jgi:purine nucleosidase
MIDLWLDTDPGFDDWMAWLLVESLPQHFRLHGVSVVAGNAPLPLTERNALRIKALHGLAAPVYRGCSQPLVQAQSTAQDVLGEEGMESTGRRLPETLAQRADGHAVQALIDCVRAQPGRITLLAVGPLTNVATAFALAPELPSLLAGLVIMGGSTVGGNATAAAEFNIHADPEAAARVFAASSAEQPVVMFGLNACAQVRVGDAELARLRALPGEAAGVFADHLDGYIAIGRRWGRATQSLYDPCPVLWLAEPSLFELRSARVEVELAGQFTRGMTVCDARPPAQLRANARVAMTARGRAALDLAFDALCRRLGPG